MYIAKLNLFLNSLNALDQEIFLSSIGDNSVKELAERTGTNYQKLYRRKRVLNEEWYLFENTVDIAISNVLKDVSCE